MKIAFDPEFEALCAFDAENDVRPVRTIAEEIALKYFLDGDVHPIVDEISHALEDARSVGAKRALAGVIA